MTKISQGKTCNPNRNMQDAVSDAIEEFTRGTKCFSAYQVVEKRIKTIQEWCDVLMKHREINHISDRVTFTRKVENTPA